MFGQILAAIGPVILTAAIGYAWRRSGRTFDPKTVTPLVSVIGTPALVISTLVETPLPPTALAIASAATICAVIGFLLVGVVALKLAGLKVKTYLPSLAFPNTGNLGLPLSLYAFGQTGLGYAIIFFSVASIVNFTIGQAIAAGRTNWLRALKNPVALSSVIGIALAYGRVSLPPWLGNTLNLIGGLSVPLMLLMLGTSLAEIRVASLPRALTVSLLRIGIGAAVGAAVTAAFGLTGTARSVLVLQCAMPVAVYNYLFAIMWNNEPEEIASLVVVSTFTSVLTIPTLLAVLLP